MPQEPDLASVRPAVYYYRMTARFGTTTEVREALLQLCSEHEKLRTYVRDELGKIPPRWSLAPVQMMDMAIHPATDFQESIRARLLERES